MMVPYRIFSFGWASNPNNAFIDSKVLEFSDQPLHGIDTHLFALAFNGENTFVQVPETDAYIYLSRFTGEPIQEAIIVGDKRAMHFKDMKRCDQFVEHFPFRIMAKLVMDLSKGVGGLN